MAKPFCFFLSGLLLVPSLLSSLAMAITNITTDEYSLLSLKAHITSDPSMILANNWSTATSVCDWIGVSCDSHHKRVIALNISNMGFTGIIPPDIGNLSFLVSLDIRNNYFHGQLPEGMTQLLGLRCIYLSYNNFAGAFPSWFGVFLELRYLYAGVNSFTGSIPLSFFNLSKLEILGLSSNKLNGIIPREIRNLALLEELHLGNNNLIGVIPNEIGDLRDLRVLNVRNCSITGLIPRNIGNLTKLEVLHLGTNNLYGVIPEEIGNIYGLVYLFLPSNNLKGQIPLSIFNMSKLELILLPNNSLSGTLPKNMCSYLPNLVILYLHKNNFQGQIPTNLDKCLSLGSLSLEKNKFSGTIPRNIGNLTMLEFIYLRQNYLTGSIPQEFSNLRKLEELYLGFNNLTGLVPVGIFNISTMRILSFVGNYFTGNLPSDMGSGLPSLEELYIGNNSFSGVIPMSISNCSRLTYIDLGLNRFSGTIPNSLGDLQHLKQLRLFENNLNSESSSSELSIITSLTNCRSLQVMSLDENPLDGILPIAIGNFSESIEGIYLSSCKIKGRIPESMGNLRNLISLDLSNNFLSGSLPSSLLGLQKLQELLLPENNIDGALPNYLCDFQSLATLNLTWNQISGHIPRCLGNVTSLRSLLISFNRLNSSVPTSLWNLKDLLDLQLASNELTGTLSPEVGKLRVVTLLDLSRNHLSGNISSTIGALQSLEKLSLAYNNLEGPIPLSFGKLFSIELLDLSHNKLSGVIPKSMEALSSLKDFNVSFNDLSGEIPSKGPFENFTSESFMFNKALCGLPRFHVRKCKAISTSRSRTMKVLQIVFILLGSITTISVTLAFFCYWCKKKKDKVPSVTEFSSRTTRERISYYELLGATNGFHENNLLGKGSFGSVYKGTLKNGMIVAVKVFHRQELYESFNTECEVFSILRHRNLTKIITSCSTADFKALVLEFIPNGSLETWLYSNDCFLNVMQRLNIMIDVAFALEYLHNGSSIPVVHCDLKPSNVLIDEDMVAHVTDFGIAKLLANEESNAYTRTLATIGYVAPEYGSEGLVSTRSDVFSFGIMLMEVFTRRKPSDEMFNGDLSLKSWVSECMPNNIIQVIDSNLLKSSEKSSGEVLECISAIVEVALICTSDSPRERKNVDEVLATLNKIKDRLNYFIVKEKPKKHLTGFVEIL